MRLLVSYGEDPGWHHERLVCYPLGADRQRAVVLTPDGDMYEESVDDWDSVSVCNWATRYDDAVNQVVAFSTPLSDAEVLRHVKEGRRLALSTIRAEGQGDPGRLQRFLNWGGDLLPLAGAGIGDAFGKRLWRGAKKRDPLAPGGGGGAAAGAGLGAVTGAGRSPGVAGPGGSPAAGPVHGADRTDRPELVLPDDGETLDVGDTREDQVWVITDAGDEHFGRTID